MRRYIISFDYKEIEFTAKVLVKTVYGRSIFSTTLINCELDFLLSRASIILTEKADCFELMLIKKDNTCEVLPWRMNAEFKDKSPVLPSSGFSLS